MNINKIELQDLMGKLPEIEELELKRNENIFLYIMFLGFEERCCSVLREVSKNDMNIENMCIVNYISNQNDNEKNKPLLDDLIDTFTENKSEFIDDGNFHCNIKDYFSDLINNTLDKDLNVILDISTGSSKLIVSLMKILFDYNINLKVVYTEAEYYLPTPEEFYKNKKTWLTEEGFGISKGVGEVIVNQEFTGSTEDKPNYIIAFPTFKPERTRAIFTYIDESFNTSFDTNKVIYFVGKPNMNNVDNNARMDMVMEINGIQDDNCIQVSTLDYKDTIRTLYQTYEENNVKYRVNISALGSKMQAIAIAIFCNTFSEVAVYHALPKEFNAKEYSLGSKKLWMINFGKIQKIEYLMNLVGQLKLSSESIDDLLV